MSILDRFEEWERLQRMGVLDTAEPDFSSLTVGGGGTMKDQKYSQPVRGDIFKNINIPKGTTVPIIPNTSTINPDASLSEAQKALIKKTYMDRPDIGESIPSIAGPFTDIGRYGWKGFASDILSSGKTSFGPSAVETQQSEINTQYYPDRMTLIDGKTGEIIYHTSKISEMQNAKRNMKSLGIDYTLEMTQKEAEKFQLGMNQIEKIDSYGRPLPQSDIVNRALTIFNENKAIPDPLSEGKIAVIQQALIPLQEDDRKFEEIRDSYTAGREGVTIEAELYRENKDGTLELLTAEDQKEIYDLDRSLSMIDLPLSFSATAASAGDISGIFGSKVTSAAEFFELESPAKAIAANRAIFNTLLQPVIYFRAKQLTQRPTAAELAIQRALLPSSEKTDRRNAVLTQEAIADIQQKVREALNQRDSIARNPLGGSLNDEQKRMIAQGPAIIELLKAIHKDFERKGKVYYSDEQYTAPDRRFSMEE